MKAVFESLGYKVSEKRTSTEGIEMEFYFISNTDGRPRWIWPSYLERPLFLKFYNISGLRSALFVVLVKLVFRLKMQDLFFRKKTISLRRNGECPFDFCFEDQWALFTGTPGPNNKAVVYLYKNGKGQFIKIATSIHAVQLLERESNMIGRLQCSNIQTFIIPEVHQVSSSAVISSDISGFGERSKQLLPLHMNVLIELNELTGVHMPLSENPSWQQLKLSFETLKRSEDKRLPKGMMRKLENMLLQVDENELIEVGMSHGDFTPWNMFVQDETLSIYDWELADMFHPLGFDLFHFVIQQGILVDRKNWQEIYTDIQRHTDPLLFSKLSKFGECDVEKYLKLYLLYNTLYYLDVYAQQKNWHQQVQWLFAVWNEALSTFAVPCYETERELVLIDTFDFMLSKNYATIKFQNMYPERLSLFSDVDMCTDKTTAKELRMYLSKHPLVKSVQHFSRSYMTTLQAFCRDGNLLSLDLIHQVKRKGLQTMNIHELLGNAYSNAFGIKMLELKDNARYIGMFYVLNGTRIPAKYTHYEEILSHSTEETDRILYPYFVDEKTSPRYLFRFVKKQSFNTGWRGVCNKLNYLADSLRTLVFHQGTIVTFSGVDGAGKSTVIASLKYLIEKQMRRRVVVLRHRPSVLPILSAWTKGREKAEYEAASTLPRQGKNRSSISSLLRFSYYYLDYLLGQFFVHVRYVMRGYVVIYDRYYFDFMNDSERSNIVLPRSILKLGFHLLIKPSYNFFLYAPADIIRSRKQELEEETINHLTEAYKQQFEYLGKQGKQSKYISINNVHLSETLNKVFTEISGQAA